jgi:DNA polymerase sigma
VWHVCLLRLSNFYDYARPFLLSVENPLEPTMDVGRNSFNVQRIQRAFSHTLNTLLCSIREVCVWVCHAPLRECCACE